MPYFQGRAGHEDCSLRIQDYLEKEGRALARDFVLLTSPDEQRAWGYYMDKTRRMCDNDRAWGDKQAVTYQHYVISPDPADNVDLETLRGLTMDWVHEFFGSELEEGALGSYEVAVVYHDDNTHHVPHAHIIVNNTNFDSGKRLQIKNNMRTRMYERVQELAEERGLHFFAEGMSNEQKAGRYYTKVERARKREGKFVWKDDLANKIDIARRTTKSVPEFVEELKALAVEVEERDNDFLYRHPSNPERWASTGYRLGRNYTRESIEKNLELANIRGMARDERFKQNVTNHVMQNFLENMELVAVVDHATTTKEVADALAIRDRYDLRSLGDFKRLVARMESAKASPALGEERAKADAEELERVRAAAAIVEAGSFFEGVEMPAKPKRQRAAAPKPSSGPKFTKPKPVKPKGAGPQVGRKKAGGQKRGGQPSGQAQRSATQRGRKSSR